MLLRAGVVRARRELVLFKFNDQNARGSGRSRRKNWLTSTVLSICFGIISKPEVAIKALLYPPQRDEFAVHGINLTAA